MKILLVGNYMLGDSKSMPRFGEMLRREMSARGHEVRLLRPRGVLGWIGGGPAGNALGKWLAYVDKYVLFPVWLWMVSGGGWDVVHICDHSNAVYGPWVRGKTPSITCHDLLAIQAAEGKFPEQRIGASGKKLQAWIKKNLLKIRRVACVSTKTAEDLKAMGAAGEVVVVHNPLNNDFSALDAATVAEVKASLGLGVDEMYALQVGGNLWYKNRPGIVRIFAELVKQDGFGALKLVMVGHAWNAALRAEVERLGLQDKVIEVANPPDRTVRALYTGAMMLLFASLYEGFGWPVLEAQSAGCVVVTSKREPMMEVSGGAAILVDPAEPAEAAEMIAGAGDRVEELRAAGLKNVERFTKEEIMGQYERFFEAR